MTRERKRARERREVKYKLQVGGTGPRRPIEADERNDMLWAIAHHNNNRFGICKLVTLELDELFTLPNLDWRGCEGRVTLLGYAAWKLRHGIVKQLLIGGATPTISARMPEGMPASAGGDAPVVALLRKLTNAAAVCVVEQVTHLRSCAARARAPLPPCAECGADGASVPVAPCGCVVCEACVW